MFKIILSLLIISSLAFTSEKKATGCDLSQVGNVEFTVESKSSKNANYSPIMKIGKSFRSILVGSTMSIDNQTLKIIDISSNKRIKREARTGTLIILLNSKDKIKMEYSFFKGNFIAQNKLKSISFKLKIEAILCYSK